MDNHPYTYVFVRTDISFEQQLVQSAHAALESGFAFNAPHETSSIVMIAAKNRNELFKIANHLESNEIQFKMFFEPDFDMGESAIATEAICCPKKRNALKKYQLYKFKDVNYDID